MKRLSLKIWFTRNKTAVAILFWSTAIAMYRLKPTGRRLSLIAAVLAIPIMWLAGVYTWWLMHSDGAKRMYGVKRE